MLTASDVISQNSTASATDTVCLPIAQVNKAINEIERGKVIAEELSLTKRKADTLEARIRIKDSTINVYRTKDGILNSIMSDYKKIIANQESMAANLKEQLILSEKRVRREKASKWYMFIFGVGATFMLTR